MFEVKAKGGDDHRLVGRAAQHISEHQARLARDLAHALGHKQLRTEYQPFVRTSDAARGISSLIGFPMLFLSGIFFPVDALPQWIQDLVHVLPVYYVSDALHQILNSGGGLPLVDVAVPLAWAAGCFALAAWRFRWE